MGGASPRSVRGAGAVVAEDPQGPLPAFFLLAAALTLPFWLLGWTNDLEVLPGLPLSGLMAFCPAIAAAILIHRQAGGAGVRALLRRSFDKDRFPSPIWWGVALLFMPAVMLLVYGLLRVAGVALPPTEPPLWAPFAMFVAFFVAGLGEELGWTAYATDPMQRRMGALWAAVLLGVVWAAWHIVPFLQADRTPEWIAWQCLKTVAVRVVMVWLYFNAGRSVFAVALFHAMDNVSAFLFPVYGSHYDPRLTALVLVAAATVLTLISGARTLAGRRTGGGGPTSGP